MLLIKSKKGFTLIEVMIVIAIIGILAAIAIPQFSTYRARGYIASVRADAKNAHTIVRGYYADNPNAGTNPPDTIVGPNSSTVYAGLNVSPGVTIVIANNAQITGSHSSISGGQYIINFDGVVTDTLTP